MIEYFFWDSGIISLMNGKEKLIGIGHYSLLEPLGYYYGDVEDKEYVEKWNEFFNLEEVRMHMS